MAAQKRWLAFADQIASSIDDQISPGTPGAANAIDLLEKEQDAALCAAAAIRRRMNALRPISRLPPEILGHVFCAYALHPKYGAPSKVVHQWEPASSTNIIHRRIGSGWVDVTQVCHSWRVAAFECPSLWSSVAIPLVWGERWAHMFAARSGVTPIVISIQNDDFGGDSMPLWIKDFLEAHMSHVGRFSMQLDLLEEGNNWLEQLGHDAPLLMHIELDFVSQLTSSRVFARLKPFRAPILRDLTISGVSSDLQGVSWPYLKNLALSNISIDVSHIITVLTTTPSLRRLCLDQLQDIIPSDLSASTIHLDKLETFNVTGDLAAGLTLWRKLDIPSSAIVRFELQEPFTATPTQQAMNLNSVLLETRRQLGRLENATRSPAGFTVAEESTGVLGSLKILAFLDPGDDFLPFKTDTCIFSVDYLGNHPIQGDHNETVGIPAIIRSIPMHGCRLLDIRAETPSLWTKAVWSKTLQETSRIEVLCLSGTAPHVGLAQAALDSFEREDDQTLFPCLHTIKFVDGLFGVKTDNDSPDIMPPALSAVLAWLERRDRCSVRNLDISACSVFAEWVARFEGIEGLTVRWDKDEMWCTAPEYDTDSDTSSDY